MLVSDILEQIKNVPGSNAKKEILQAHAENDSLKKALVWNQVCVKIFLCLFLLT